ncbi:MAG TPA: HAD-IA family hydrolase [Nitrolancea sp.]
MSTPCFAVELVTFDIGGTLLTFRPDQVHEWSVVLDEVGVTVEAARIEAALAEARPRAAAHRRATVSADHRVTVESGEARRRRYIAEVLRGAGVSDGDVPRAEEAVKQAFDSPRMYVAYDDALPALRELWLRGLKLAAVSNTWPAMPKVLMALGFDDYLGYWVVSEFLGVEKPDPAIFERALDIAAVEPSRAIHVGDDAATDIDGALGVGMRAVLLDRSGTAQSDGRAPVIQRLDELLTIVE